MLDQFPGNRYTYFLSPDLDPEYFRRSDPDPVRNWMDPPTMLHDNLKEYKPATYYFIKEFQSLQRQFLFWKGTLLKNEMTSVNPTWTEI